MRAYNIPNLKNPMMAERLPGSMFTPAISAWSSPGQLGALGDLPSWSGYAAAAAFLALAYFRKVPWTVGIVGAGLSWWFLGAQGNMVGTITSGTVISANGTTLSLGPNTPGQLTTTPTGTQTMTVGTVTYPVLTTTPNADGTITYYVDNPS